MTKNQFNRKAINLIRRLETPLLEECRRLYNTGTIDAESFKNDYALPRIMLRVAMENKAQLTAPNRWLKDQRYMNDYTNLKRLGD